VEKLAEGRERGSIYKEIPGREKLLDRRCSQAAEKEGAKF
jgi:hypothetical protein